MEDLPPNFFLMINIASYNIRGLNNRSKQANFAAFLKENSLSFVGILETCLKQCTADNIARSINPN